MARDFEIAVIHFLFTGGKGPRPLRETLGPPAIDAFVVKGHPEEGDVLGLRNRSKGGRGKKKLTRERDVPGRLASVQAKTEGRHADRTRVSPEKGTCY